MPETGETLKFAVIYPSGIFEVRTEPYGLATLQKAVGGYIEFVDTANLGLVAYVDEDGLANRREMNPVGTEVLTRLGSRARHSAGFVLGPVVFVGSHHEEEESLTDEQIALIRAVWQELAWQGE
jgi:hypothetical protein